MHICSNLHCSDHPSLLFVFFFLLAQKSCHSFMPLKTFSFILLLKLSQYGVWSSDIGLWRKKDYIRPKGLTIGIVFQDRERWPSFISDWKWLEVSQMILLRVVRLGKSAPAFYHDLLLLIFLWYSTAERIIFEISFILWGQVSATKDCLYLHSFFFFFFFYDGPLLLSPSHFSLIFIRYPHFGSNCTIPIPG